jgi:phage tail-like protein
VVAFESRDKVQKWVYRQAPPRLPARIATMDGPGRLIFGAADNGVFSAAFGLLGTVQALVRVPGMGAIGDLLWTDGILYAATERGIYAVEAAAAAAPALRAQYISPVLRSPISPRSGWLRADLLASLPAGAQVTIRSRGMNDEAAFTEALRDDPLGALVQEDWNDGQASRHFGTGADEPLRHYLGEETAEYLALRFDISLPASSPPVTLRRLDVLYPNRSLIEQLPAIYRTGDSSEAQLRRVLAPFQALADEIDDLIGDSIRRVDPDKTDDIWTGFLLSWLGHGAFSRLPVSRRRELLKAMPEILPKRGTLEGLARVMDVMAPQGYAIEDTGLGPDIWVLPDRNDPAGARLGRETLAGAGAPDGLRLGCDVLGDVHIGRICFDPATVAWRCSSEVTVRVFGGEEVKEALAPFTDRIVRAFVPAHTRVTFVFGPHLPPEALERGRPVGPDADADTLITIDPGLSRALGAWRLPNVGSRIVRENVATLNSAVLDGTLVLA